MLQFEVLCAQVVFYAQMSLALFEHVLKGLFCEALLACARKASLFVGIQSCIVPLFGAIYSLPIDNQVQAAVDIISEIICSRFDKS